LISSLSPGKIRLTATRNSIKINTALFISPPTKSSRFETGGFFFADHIQDRFHVLYGNAGIDAGFVYDFIEYSVDVHGKGVTDPRDKIPLTGYGDYKFCFDLPDIFSRQGPSGRHFRRNPALIRYGSQLTDHTLPAFFTVSHVRRDSERAKTVLQTMGKQDQNPAGIQRRPPELAQHSSVVKRHKRGSNIVSFPALARFPRFTQQIQGIITAVNEFCEKRFYHFDPLLSFISL
jgi:hypothetical protein